MMKKHNLFFVTALVTLFYCSGLVFAAGEVSETGTAGMSFLKITPSARQQALGGISSAAFTGASSMWANPALVSRSEERTVDFTHIEWIEGIRQESAALTTKTSLGSIGFSMQVFNSDDIELRGNTPSSSPLGSYTITNAAFGLTYARPLFAGIAAGVTFKKLFEKVSSETANGYAIDAGLIAPVSKVEGLTVSVAARNNGRMGKLKNDRSKLPSDVVVGGAFEGVAPGIERPVVVAGDYVFPKYGDGGVRLGVEIEAVERFMIRMGYRSDSDIEDVSFGIGIEYQKFDFDFAYAPMKEGFDDTMRFTVGLTGF